MYIKKATVACIIMISISMISAVSIVCAEVDSRNSASASQASNVFHVGMSKDDLFKIYHRGDIRKFEERGNEEVFVFDDTLTPVPDDTITFYLIDGKVKEWDKNIVIFPTDEGLTSAIPGISKEDLLRIYNIGNLKAYSRNGNEEIGTFYDISTSDPDDTITFYLVDGKVKSWTRSKLSFPTSEDLHKIFPVGMRKAYAKSGNTEAETYYNTFTSDPSDTITFYLSSGRVVSWEINTEASASKVKLMDEINNSVRPEVQSNADIAKADAKSKAKAEADFKEMMSRARSDADARMRAMEERDRYNYSNSLSSKSKQEAGIDDIIKTKQKNRASSVQNNNWHYNGRLYYR